MNKLVSCALAASFVATQAVALSCLKPDVAKAFQEASASDRNYVVLKGKFAFTPLAQKQRPTAERIDATFNGRLLTSAGFTQQVSAPVEIDLTCAGDWCAKMEPRVEMIAFVENRADQNLVFEVGPCYALAFQEPSEEDVKRLENCAQGGACAPEPNSR